MRVPRKPITCRRSRLVAAVALCAGVLALLATAAPALAAGHWRLSARAAPTHLPPGGKGFVDVQATNFGDTGINALGAGESVVVTDTLPEGVTIAKELGVQPS